LVVSPNFRAEPNNFRESLVTTSVENSFRLGPIDALTGPIQRGDSSTVQAHLREIRNLPDSVRRLYCAVGELVVQMAMARGLHETKASEIQEMLRAETNTLLTNVNVRPDTAVELPLGE
jgi:predicted short-subunit dehydrogenase-like oxidoreductase (DUF2520 family)